METMLTLTDDLTFARVFLERAEHTIGAVVEGYFEDLTTSHDGAAFDEARIMAEIGRDYLIDLRKVLGSMSAAVADAEHPDPVRRLEQLNIAALRTGKGRDAIGILEKHEVKRFEDVPLGKFKALEGEYTVLLNDAH